VIKDKGAVGKANGIHVVLENNFRIPEEKIKNVPVLCF